MKLRQLFRFCNVYLVYIIPFSVLPNIIYYWFNYIFEDEIIFQQWLGNNSVILSIFCVPLAFCMWFLKNAPPSIVIICIIVIYWENYAGRVLCTSGFTMFPERLSHRHKNMLNICWMNKYMNKYIQYWVDFTFFPNDFSLISKYEHNWESYTIVKYIFVSDKTPI